MYTEKQAKRWKEKGLEIKEMEKGRQEEEEKGK